MRPVFMEDFTQFVPLGLWKVERGFHNVCQVLKMPMSHVFVGKKKRKRLVTNYGRGGGLQNGRGGGGK